MIKIVDIVQLFCAVHKTKTIQCRLEIVSSPQKVSPRCLKIKHTLPKSVFCLSVPLLCSAKLITSIMMGKIKLFMSRLVSKKKLRWLTKIHKIKLKLSEGNEARSKPEEEGGRCMECSCGNKRSMKPCVPGAWRLLA